LAIYSLGSAKNYLEDTIKDTAPRNRDSHHVTQENFVGEASCVSVLWQWYRIYIDIPETNAVIDKINK